MKIYENTIRYGHDMNNMVGYHMVSWIIQTWYGFMSPKYDLFPCVGLQGSYPREQVTILVATHISSYTP